MTRETYRGVKLTAQRLRGRDYGLVRYTVNGTVFGAWIGTEERAIRSMRGYVDDAIVRPEAYEPYWQPRS